MIATITVKGPAKFQQYLAVTCCATAWNESPSKRRSGAGM